MLRVYMHVNAVHMCVHMLVNAVCVHACECRVYVCVHVCECRVCVVCGMRAFRYTQRLQQASGVSLLQAQLPSLSQGLAVNLKLR